MNQSFSNQDTASTKSIISSYKIVALEILKKDFLILNKSKQFAQYDPKVFKLNEEEF